MFTRVRRKAHDSQHIAALRRLVKKNRDVAKSHRIGPRDGGCGHGSIHMSFPLAKDCGDPGSLNTYLREIRDDSLLSAAEEHSLADAIAQGADDGCGAPR